MHAVQKPGLPPAHPPRTVLSLGGACVSVLDKEMKGCWGRKPTLSWQTRSMLSPLADDASPSGRPKAKTTLTLKHNRGTAPKQSCSGGAGGPLPTGQLCSPWWQSASPRTSAPPGAVLLGEKQVGPYSGSLPVHGSLALLLVRGQATLPGRVQAETRAVCRRASGSPVPRSLPQNGRRFPTLPGL